MLKIDNPKACGFGKGADCCAFLTMGEGFLCGRTDPGIRSTIESRLATGTINAKGHPTEEFPACQKFAEV